MRHQYDTPEEFNDHYTDDGRIWRECWNCGGDLYVDHDCGEDTCCCLWPEDNVKCDICNGNGGWYLTEAER
jgi:hypothetical protein